MNLPRQGEGNGGLRDGVALSFCVSLLSFRLLPRLFIYMPFVFLLLASIFFSFFACFLFLPPPFPHSQFFSARFGRLLYGLVVVNQRARMKIKGPRQICLIAYNLWSKRVSAPAHTLCVCICIDCHRNQFECGTSRVL